MFNKRILAAFLACLVAVPAFAGCSTGYSELDAAFKKTNSLASVTANMKMDFTVQDISVLSVSGDIISTEDDGIAKGFANVDVVSMGEALSFSEYVESDGKNVYVAVQIPEEARESETDPEYVVLDTSKVESNELSALDILALEEKLTEALAVATEDIEWSKTGGVYALNLTSDALYDLIVKVMDVVDPTASDEALYGAFSIKDYLENIQIESEIEDGYISKVAFTANLAGAALGAENVKVTGEMTYSDYNKPQTITRPDLTNAVVADFFEVLSEDSIVVYMDGKMVDFPEDSTPFEMDSRTMVPARVLTERLGGEISYVADGLEENIVITLGNSTIALVAGRNYAVIDGDMMVELDVPPVIVNDRTMLPLRFVSENFGKTVNHEYKTVFGQHKLVIEIL